MFKTILTAAALILTASVASATGLDATSLTQDILPVQELAYYCEWAYVYDVYGNWVTAWQCY